MRRAPLAISVLWQTVKEICVEFGWIVVLAAAIVLAMNLVLVALRQCTI